MNKVDLALEFAKRQHKDLFTKLAGAENIFGNLFENGSVTTTIDVNFGFIGNFIDSNVAENAVGCYQWELNPSFWHWDQFIQFIETKTHKLIEEKEKIEQELDDTVFVVREIKSDLVKS